MRGNRRQTIVDVAQRADRFGVGEEARWQLGLIVRLSRLPAFMLSAGGDVPLGDDALERLLRTLPREALAA